MNNDINILNDKFLQVKKLNWIKATSKGNGNVGITFENAIGKERENFPIADYNGIEIKTSLNKNTRPYITLFSATPDGPYIFGTQTLKEKYGWTSPKLKGYKVFYARVNGKKLKKINNKHFMKINVDYNNEKIFLEVYDLNYQLLEKECFWNFKTIEEKLQTKIHYLAYIKAERKYENRQVFFKYTEITFLKLKSFKQFIFLLDSGKINICFKIGVYLSKNKLGKTYDHGTGFEIRKELLLNLYNIIETN